MFTSEDQPKSKNVFRTFLAFCQIFFFCISWSLVFQPNKSYALNTLESGMCQRNSFKVNHNSIIKTDNSLANGATVIKTLHSYSFNSCLQSCCYNLECTVAVFETTGKNLCYLFSCGKDASLCEFEEHFRFSSAIKLKRNAHQTIHLPDKATEAPEKSSQSDQQLGQEYLNQPNPRDDSVFQNQSMMAATTVATPPGKHRAELSQTKTVGLGAGQSPAATPVITNQRNFAASDLDEHYRQTRSAILGLGIALGFTLLTVAVLGFRLRQLRARMGPGGHGGIVGINGKLRGRGVDDEDYLINGMYL